MTEKPKLKGKPKRPTKLTQPPKQPENPSATRDPERGTPEREAPEREALNIQSAVARDVPLMFQAQIPERGNIQYAGDVSSASNWVKQWLQGCPNQPENVDESQPIWKRKTVSPTVKLPEFGAHVKTWEYQIRWRMVTNGGQDEGVIRPVIGAKGMPFFPGSSMKGAFRRACPEDKRMRYCGGEEITVKGEKRTLPGILRFHGGYPVDMSWAQRDRLVDIAHGQQPYQVMRSEKKRGENANVQISLYQPRFKFGISSSRILPDEEWQEIQQIWEKALGCGIGSRVSAGYGYVDRVKQDNSTEPIANPDRTLLSIHLNGEGLTSMLLLNKTPEFRPNMFKAALRGHTLRLLGGITDEQTAKSLTKIIWGGIPEKGEGDKAVVGRVGIDFTVEGDLNKGNHTYNNGRVFMPTYELEYGRLDLLQIGEVKPKLKNFLNRLVQFSLLLGGFGKSWRRIDHQRFYSNYFGQDNKPMIGCHWELATLSDQLCVTTGKSDLGNITKFLDQIKTDASKWMESEGKNYQSNSYAQNWEAWYKNKVQVWGRLAKDGQSVAVEWFHDTNRLKGSSLAGKMGQIGRIWHRMYPRYVLNKDKELIHVKRQYVELLTIFPDDSDNKSKRFMNWLATGNSGFNRLW